MRSAQPQGQSSLRVRPRTSPVHGRRPSAGPRLATGHSTRSKDWDESPPLRLLVGAGAGVPVTAANDFLGPGRGLCSSEGRWLVRAVGASVLQLTPKHSETNVLIIPSNRRPRRARGEEGRSALTWKDEQLLRGLSVPDRGAASLHVFYVCDHRCHIIIMLLLWAQQGLGSRGSGTLCHLCRLSRTTDTPPSLLCLSSELQTRCSYTRHFSTCGAILLYQADHPN